MIEKPVKELYAFSNSLTDWVSDHTITIILDLEWEKRDEAGFVPLAGVPTPRQRWALRVPPGGLGMPTPVAGWS